MNLYPISGPEVLAVIEEDILFKEFSKLLGTEPSVFGKEDDHNKYFLLSVNYIHYNKMKKYVEVVEQVLGKPKASNKNLRGEVNNLYIGLFKVVNALLSTFSGFQESSVGMEMLFDDPVDDSFIDQKLVLGEFDSFYAKFDPPNKTRVVKFSADTQEQFCIDYLLCQRKKSSLIVL